MSFRNIIKSNGEYALSVFLVDDDIAMVVVRKILGWLPMVGDGSLESMQIVTFSGIEIDRDHHIITSDYNVLDEEGEVVAHSLGSLDAAVEFICAKLVLRGFSYSYENGVLEKKEFNRVVCEPFGILMDR